MSIIQTEKMKTPWHLWGIGVVALLWNSVGAFDFMMTQIRDQAYLSTFTPEQLAFFNSYPTWLIIAWGVGVWGGVMASVYLLLRKRFAFWLYLASLLGVILTNIHTFLLSDGMNIMGDSASLIFTGVIFMVAVALFLYAHAMTKRGVLR